MEQGMRKITVNDLFAKTEHNDDKNNKVFILASRKQGEYGQKKFIKP